MKVYTRVVIDIDTGQIIDAVWSNYDGQIALAKKKKRQQVSTVTQETKQPELTEQEISDIRQGVRSGAAARGLASSTLTQAMEEEEIRRAKSATRPIQSTSTTTAPQPPRGLFGLK